MKALSYIFPVLYLVFTSGFGQGIHLFWLSSSGMALAVNFALRKTLIGKALGTLPFKKEDEFVVPTTFSTKAKSLKALKDAHKKKHD